MEYPNLGHFLPEEVIEDEFSITRVRRFSKTADEQLAEGARTGWIVDPILTQISIEYKKKRPKV